MNGYEVLKHALLEKGYKQQQVDAAVVHGVLEVLASDTAEVLKDLQKLTKERDELKAENARLEAQKAERLRQIMEYNRDNDLIKEEMNKLADELYKETKDYIDRFFEALEQCETPEKRDRLKLAQMYMNSIDIDSKYDKTAFIIGLAAVLSPGGIAAINELRKINENIPGIEFEAHPSKMYSNGKGWNVSAKQKRRADVI